MIYFAFFSGLFFSFLFVSFLFFSFLFFSFLFFSFRFFLFFFLSLFVFFPVVFSFLLEPYGLIHDTSNIDLSKNLSRASDAQVSRKAGPRRVYKWKNIEQPSYIYIPIHMDPMGNPTRPKLNCHGSSLQLNHTLEFENEEMTLTRTIPWEPTTCSSSGYIPYIGWFRSLHFWFHVFGVESGYSIFPNISPDFWLCQTPCSKRGPFG